MTRLKVLISQRFSLKETLYNMTDNEVLCLYDTCQGREQRYYSCVEKQFIKSFFSDYTPKRFSYVFEANSKLASPLVQGCTMAPTERNMSWTEESFSKQCKSFSLSFPEARDVDSTQT